LSRAPQRVLRAVRLLPEAVKIGIEPEPALSPQPEEEQDLHEREPNPSADEAVEPVSEGPDPELLRRIEELQAELGSARAQLAEASEARGRLESEIDGVRADCDRRRRELEEGAAAAAQEAAREAQERGRREGWDKGHDEGLAAARAEVEKQYLDKFSALTDSLEGIRQGLEGSFAELVALNQPRLLRLWQEMLGRMLRRRVELDPDAVGAILTDLLPRLSDKNQVVIYVSPEDHACLEADVDTRFQEALRGVRRLELKADANVDRGSCIVETSLGVYDARWRTQLEQVGGIVDDILQQVTKGPGGRQGAQGSAGGEGQ